MTTPLRPDPVADFLRRLADQKRESQSLATWGRAKAKGTGLEWVNPRLSVGYVRAKAGRPNLRGLPLVPQSVVADDTAAPVVRPPSTWDMLYAMLFGA